jgi:hypothetical protein
MLGKELRGSPADAARTGGSGDNGSLVGEKHGHSSLVLPPGMCPFVDFTDKREVYDE